MLHHPAAGAEDLHPADRQPVHQHVQGHLAGDHHRAVRSADHRQDGAHRSAVAGVLRGSLPVRGADLLDVLVLHVALQPVPGAPAGDGAPRAEEEWTR